MSTEISGIKIETEGLLTVGLFMVAIIPGYLWASKGTTPRVMYNRSAIVGFSLLGAALVTGLRLRK